MRIDLNSDVGEGFGAYSLGDDSAILDCVSSANIACGFHAGDPNAMRHTVALAMARGVAIGAHPGLPDLVGFGRREMSISPTETRDLVMYQIGALDAFARAAGGGLRHVKPHGALYNMAIMDIEIATSIAQAVAQFDRRLILVGLAGSRLIDAGAELGLTTAREAFVDRMYEDDGTLTSRRIPGAVITDERAVIAQCLSIIARSEVATRQGGIHRIEADTLCLHGDTPGAARLARLIRQSLESGGIEIRAFGH